MTSPRQLFTRLGQFVALALLGLGAAALWRGGGDDLFMPHAHCYLFNGQLMALHGISDFLIGLAYVAISATLVFLVYRARREIPFHWMMLAFAAFIVACGATHFMEVWTLQAAQPRYWLSGSVKLVTAVASVATALLLPPLIPKILELLHAARTSAERKQQLETAYVELGNLYEQVKQLDQLKTSFFANVSHELRTPIALIFGPVDRLLASQQLSGEVKRDLRLARRNALLLHKHVNDLLDVSRLDAGKMNLHLTHADLAAMIRRTAATFESIATERILQLEIDAPSHLLVPLDEEKIERVLLNLLSNAFKFVPEGGTISLRLREEEGKAVLLVEDSGPGIPPKFRTAVFERFQQGDPELQRRYGGSGLGLAIVKEFVELHHGTVTVSESAAGGAAFRVELQLLAPAGVPIREATPHRAPVSAREPGQRPSREEETAWILAQEDRLERAAPGTGGPPAVNGHRPRVLIVEDNHDMREFIARVLADDYRILAAGDGRQALEMARAEPPDLILSDMMMPGLSGEELLAALRADERLGGVPVIFLTARADDELKLWALQEGAQDYVMKPFAVEELRARVRTQLTAKLTRDTLQRELASQTRDLTQLAEEVTLRARDLAQAREEAESASRAKDQFLAVLSHELRTPLTPALVAATQLESAPQTDPEELRESISMIRRNIELEARLVDDLLDLTRITRGKLQLNLDSVDVHELLRHAGTMAHTEMTQQRIELRFELAAQRHHISGDGARLLQVFWNLLLNAAKFTPEGGTVTVRTSNEDQGRLRIAVSDTGVGIEPTQLARIFEPFQQGEAGLARRFGGLGLGLTVARALIDAHGGTIAAQSAGPALGSTFLVELATADAAPPTPPPAAPPAAAVPARVLRILLVEDHPDTRAVLERQLKRWGHDVKSAGTLAEARARVRAGEFDLLVSDIGLPDGTGLELIRELRQTRPIEGIAMSGYGMESDLRQSQEAGFREHLVKPLALEQLKQTLSRLVPPGPGTPASP